VFDARIEQITAHETWIRVTRISLSIFIRAVEDSAIIFAVILFIYVNRSVKVRLHIG
jgi:hypothetical protein